MTDFGKNKIESPPETESETESTENGKENEEETFHDFPPLSFFLFFEIITLVKAI